MNRRQFIRTATGGAAGIVLGGSPLLASCSSDAGVKTTTYTASTGGTVAATAPPSGTSGSAEATVFRLSTRNQHAPCKACKAHAAHRYYATRQAADTGRAHPGCTCAVREQRTTAAQLERWFPATGGEVFDDRRTT